MTNGNVLAAPAPAVAVTFTTNVAVCGTFEVEFELLEPPPQPTAFSASTRMAVIPSKRFRCLRRPNGNSKPARANVDGSPRSWDLGTALAAATVALTVTFVVAGLIPSSVTEAGANVQLTFAGRFPQLNDTVCVEPPKGMTLIVAEPVCRPAKVRLAGAACMV